MHRRLATSRAATSERHTELESEMRSREREDEVSSAAADVGMVGTEDVADVEGEGVPDAAGSDHAIEGEGVAADHDV